MGDEVARMRCIAAQNTKETSFLLGVLLRKLRGQSRTPVPTINNPTSPFNKPPLCKGRWVCEANSEGLSTSRSYSVTYTSSVTFGDSFPSRGSLKKPSSERKVARRSRDGRSLRRYAVLKKVTFIKLSVLRTLPQSANADSPL